MKGHNQKANFNLKCINLGTLNGQLQRDTWIDICADGFSKPYDCCHKSLRDPSDPTGNTILVDEGMEGHEYLITVTSPQSYALQRQKCLLLDSIGDTTHGYQLVTFETKKENYCVAKYLAAEYPKTNFFLGLKAETDEINAFYWDDEMFKQAGYDAAKEDPDVPAFTNWSPTSPAGLECVKMEAGPASVLNGLWQTTACDTPQFSICERYLLSTITTTSTSTSTSTVKC